MYTSDSNTGKTALVAIVGTRGDKISKEEDHEKISSELKELFSEMPLWQSLVWYERGGAQGPLSFFPNNNTLTKDNAVSQQLLKGIEQGLENADYMKREISILWIKMLDEMKAVNRHYLSYEEVVMMAKQKYPRDTQRNLQQDTEEMKEEMTVRENLIMAKEVRKMLRFLNDMGMLMWIEETDLDDVIILDPIEYLVKPATTIICKHIATKDDP
eukprot:CAMPEP_0173149908 /NCGR_PEP_ID=MMETSP1105-20130129/10618_1 /TAXON_ID=2985 /ORGANISM="Ochromonas sp., Strain BG-1" /LENGTH=213 /DNA_ID=CAMNT_0014064889 /DNA_START=49 /DNA_END=686 /DNA_ORIENTATION=+